MTSRLIDNVLLVPDLLDRPLGAVVPWRGAVSAEFWVESFVLCPFNSASADKYTILLPQYSAGTTSGELRSGRSGLAARASLSVVSLSADQVLATITTHVGSIGSDALNCSSFKI